MKDKLTNLFLKDKRVIRNMFLLICAALLTFSLVQYNRRQAKLIRELRQKHDLIMRIPELEQKNKLLAMRAGISLTGVILGNPPSAVINGIILKIGDEIMGKKVTEIKENSVVLSNGNETVELQLE